jgi:Mrp family chromosome partitioning ATPase
MESVSYLRILGRRWKVIVAAAFIATLAVLLLAPVQSLGSSRYEATATLVQRPGTVRTVDFTAMLVTTGPVPGNVAARLGGTEDTASLSSMVDAAATPETTSVTITATSSDADMAALVANTFAEETIAEVQRRARIGDEDPGLEILQRAVASRADTGGIIRGPTSQAGRLLLGFTVGLILGSALALLLERFNTTVRDRAEVQSAYRLPVLAEIPRLPRRRRGAGSVILLTDPVSTAAEAFRSLRSSVLLISSRVLQTADGGAGRLEAAGDHTPPQIILVASARSGEGKTTTAVNLAAALAEGGQRVLLLDCDFRRPDAHRFLDVPDGPGLSDVIHAGEGAHDLLALTRPTAVEGVRLVTAGTMVDQPPALPTRIAGLLAEARGLAEVVIVDSSPMLLGNDAMDLMPYVDTVLVTCRSGRLTRDQAERASELLARMRVPVVGAALVGARPQGLGHLITHRAVGSSERRDRQGEASAHRPAEG